MSWGDDIGQGRTSGRCRIDVTCRRRWRRSRCVPPRGHAGVDEGRAVRGSTVGDRRPPRGTIEYRQGVASRWKLAAFFVGESASARAQVVQRLLLDVGQDVVDPSARLAPVGAAVGVARPGDPQPPVGNRPVTLSWFRQPRASCLRLFLHCSCRAASRAACTAGSNSAIRMPMIVITTNSSTNVNAASFSISDFPIYDCLDPRLASFPSRCSPGSRFPSRRRRTTCFWAPPRKRFVAAPELRQIRNPKS